MNQFERIVNELKVRSPMYLPDRRYESMVAFLEGFGLGTGEDPLRGFSDWLAKKWLERASSWHWSVLVAAEVRPSLRDENGALSLMSAEEQDEAKSKLLEVLTEFLAAPSDARDC